MKTAAAADVEAVGDNGTTKTSAARDSHIVIGRVDGADKVAAARGGHLATARAITNEVYICRLTALVLKGLSADSYIIANIDRCMHLRVLVNNTAARSCEFARDPNFDVIVVGAIVWTGDREDPTARHRERAVFVTGRIAF